MRFGRIAPLLTLAVVLPLAAGVPSCGKSDSGGSKSIDDLDVDETFDLPTLTAPVDVVRDDLGRPHVYAANTRDLAVVTGWLHATDRFIQMDLQRRFANGQLAELVGALGDPIASGATAQDVLSRAIGLRLAAQVTYDALPEGSEGKEALNGYAEGVNAWLASRNGVRPTADYDLFSYPFSQTPPWSPVDSLAIGRLLSLQLAFDDQDDLVLKDRFDAASAAFPALDPREGFLDDVVLRFEPSVKYAIVNPSLPSAATSTLPVSERPSSSTSYSPAVAAKAKEFLASVRKSPFNPLKDASYGSNNWVVSGDRTKSGHPILANDPHLSLELPPIWYELHLNTTRAGGDYEVIGVSLPGIPVVIIGANGKIAWGVTNVGPDVTDLYVEQYSAVGSNGGMAVMWDDDGNGSNPAVPVDLLTDSDPIIVRTSISTTSAVPNVVYRIPHRNGGNAAIIPGTMVVGSSGEALSWSWTGFEPSGEVLTLIALARAQSGADLEAAVNEWDVPPQNFVYADDEGNIGYVANGFYPVRGDDDGNPLTDPPYFPQPGYTGTHEWIGRVAREDVPQEVNPARGWIATANQDPLGHTYDNNPLNDDVYIGFAYDGGFRGYQIDSALEADDSITPTDMMNLQGNDVSSLGQRFLPLMAASITGHANEMALLQGWGDRGFHAASGVGDDVPADEIDDAAATSLFNAWLIHLWDRALGDEMDQAGIGLGSQELVRALLYLLERPTEAATYDAVAGESILWDDLTTTPAVETKDDVFEAAMVDALAFLASGDGFSSADPTNWRWGLLHHRILPRQSSLPGTSLPSSEDEEFTDGFYPRHGDQFGVDVQNFAFNGNFANEGGGGASMRLVIEMIPGGKMKIWNVLPGGSSGDPESVHYGDQANVHAKNGYFRTWWTENDVAGHAESRVVFE